MPVTEMGDYAGLLARLNVPKAKVYPVLEGKVAIITGAAQGMGKATALLFAEAGASVVLAGVNESGIKDVAAEIEKAGGRAFAVKTDISSSEDVQNMVNRAVAEFGRLDCAVNNAALTPDGAPFTEFDEDYFDRLMSINLKGHQVRDRADTQAGDRGLDRQHLIRRCVLSARKHGGLHGVQACHCRFDQAGG